MDSDCEHSNKTMISVVVGTDVNRHMVRKQTCKDCGQVLAIY